MVNLDQKTASIVLCLALFAVAFALRAIGADFGLINVDERINDSARFLTGDLVPSQHFYPPFLNYLIGVAFAGLYVVGIAFDWWQNTSEFRQVYFDDPTPFYLTARYLTAFIGALSALVFFSSARRTGLPVVSSALVGAFAALLPLNVFMGHIAKGDTGVATACVAVVWAFLFRIDAENRGRWDVIIGLMTVFALSFKHSAVLVLGPLAIAMIWCLARREGFGQALRSFALSLGVVLLFWPLLNIGVVLDIQGFIDFQKIQAVMSVREEEPFGAGLPVTLQLVADGLFGLNPIILILSLIAPIRFMSPSCKLRLKDALLAAWLATVVSTVAISLIVGTRQPPHLFQANVTLHLFFGALVLLDMVRAFSGLGRGVIAVIAAAGLLLMGLGSYTVVKQALATPVAEDVVSFLQEQFPKNRIHTSYTLPVPRTVAAQRVQLDRWDRLAEKYKVNMPPLSAERLVKKDVDGALFWVPAPFVMFGLEADDVFQSEFPVRPHTWPIQPDEWVLQNWLDEDYTVFVVNGLERMIEGLRSSHMRTFYREVRDRCAQVKYYEVRKPLFDEYDVTVFDCSDA